MESADENRWADADSLLGLLQRGRGEGYRRSLIERELGSDWVVDCIINDPRWDRQVEDRSWFYAALVAELDIDLSLLRPAYAEGEDGDPNPFGWDTSAWLATDVFELAAIRGIPGAVTELRRYLRTERDTGLALEHLLPLATHTEASGLLEEILEIADPEQLRAELSWSAGDFTADPWPSWRRGSIEFDAMVQEILAEHAARPTPMPMSERREQFAAERRELLLRTALEADPGTAASRLVELRDGQEEDVLLEIAPALLEDPAVERKVKTAVRRMLSKLDSPKALEWARTKASLEDEGGDAALRLLAKLSSERDLPQMRSLLDQAVSIGNERIYAQCDLVEGIGRLCDGASLTIIETLYEETVYSYLRTRCAKVLASIDERFSSTRAFECLYDCDEDTRLLGITTVDTSLRGVAERLAEIVDDPTETDTCRKAAMQVR